MDGQHFLNQTDHGKTQSEEPRYTPLLYVILRQVQICLKFSTRQTLIKTYIRRNVWRLDKRIKAFGRVSSTRKIEIIFRSKVYGIPSSTFFKIYLEGILIDRKGSANSWESPCRWSSHFSWRWTGFQKILLFVGKPWIPIQNIIEKCEYYQCLESIILSGANSEKEIAEKIGQAK